MYKMHPSRDIFNMHTGKKWNVITNNHNCIPCNRISHRTQRENIFCQAGFVQNVYKKMQTVMNMYEDGDLKDQKLNKKQLTAVPEFKQHHMQLLHNLKDSFQSAILQRVIDKEISLKKMKDEADKFRALEGTQFSMFKKDILGRK